MPETTHKTIATVGIILILSLGIFLSTKYEKPNAKVVVPVQSKTTSVSVISKISCTGNACSSQKHHYNPSPSVPCNIGKNKSCSAVFTVNGKRTDYLK